MSAVYPPDDEQPSHRDNDERSIIDRVIDRIIGDSE